MYFDDVTISLTPGKVVQEDDYYPFGLTFNSYQRENSLANQYKFQGQEHQDELDLGWDSFKWRNHIPEIGRFFNVDPLAEKYVYNSPYAFSENKVTNHIELEGLEAALPKYLLKNEVGKVEKAIEPAAQSTKSFMNKIGDAFNKLGNAIAEALDFAPENGGGFTVTGPTQPGSTGPSRQGTSSGELDGSAFIGPVATKSVKPFFEAFNITLQVADQTQAGENSTTDANTQTNNPEVKKEQSTTSPSAQREYCVACTKPGDTTFINNPNDRIQHQGFTNKDLEKKNP